MAPVYLRGDPRRPGKLAMRPDVWPTVVFFVLWNVGGRLGPLLPPPRPRRRDILAHLRALGEFHWRYRRGSRLTRVTRERVEQAWLRRHPVLRGMTAPERTEWIGQQTGLSPDQVRTALYPVGVDDRLLLEETRLLQKLWVTLSHPRGRLARREKGNDEGD